ncbi:MAG: VOC family protein, partial [Planctomycetia bacterium]
MLLTELDHLVVTAPDLGSGIEWVEHRLECRMQPGGRHPRMGTHNALVR